MAFASCAACIACLNDHMLNNQFNMTVFFIVLHVVNRSIIIIISSERDVEQ